MLRKFLCVAALAMFAGPAQAGVLGASLSFDGNIDFVNDDSAGVFVDLTGNGIADLVQGVIWFDATNTAGNIFPATGGSLFGIYSFDLTNNGQPIPSLAFTGTAASSAGQTVRDLLKFGTGDSADFSGLITRDATVSNAFTIIETMGNYSLNNWRNTAAAGTPMNLEFDFGSGWTSDLSSFDVALEAGLDGIDDSHNIQIFFGGSGGPIGAFNGTYTVRSDVFGSGVQFLDLTNALSGGVGQIIIENGSISSPESTGVGVRGFNFSDRGTFQVNAVPEPSTIIGFLALAGLGMGRSVRRRANR
ncbi:MAG TPA: hypothetical protein DDZ51_25175 [Planctomycetaceae bacterium]|nr:hypothetical protein [Planctomycetaceae bacterium]